MANVNDRDAQKATVARAQANNDRLRLAHEKCVAVGDSDAVAIDAIMEERGCTLDEAIEVFVGETS